MATRKPKAGTVKIKRGEIDPVDKPSRVKDQHLEDISERDYVAYSVAVNEDRSIPALVDGMKPVHRRAIWGAYKLGLLSNRPRMKSARAVGDTMGKYHPHGDKAIYDTYVTLANYPAPLIDGEGNWGNLSDPQAAAMRYTNLRLTKLAEAMLLDKFYLAVTDMVPNYDHKEEEPLELPALLPNLLLNGTFGIGVGIQVQVPSYTAESLVGVIKKVLAGTPCDAKMCKSLVFATEHGGVADLSTEAARAEVMQLYKTGSGSVTFKSVYAMEDGGKVMRFTAFAPFARLENVIAKVQQIQGVLSVNDMSDVKDENGTVVVKISPRLLGKTLASVISRVEAAFSTRLKFQTAITERFKTDKGEAAARFRSTTIPTIINDWVKARLALEVKACTYWIGEIDKDIRYYELLRIAVANRKLIIQALDKDLDDAELEAYLAKSLKITVPEAKIILDLKIRQLKALEDKKLVDKIKSLKTERAGLDKRAKKPAEYVPTQLDALLKAVK